MKDLFVNQLQKDVQERQARIEKLDQKIVDYSRQLVKDEVKSHESFIDNEYFLKLSDPNFCRLSAPEQLLYLVLWSYQRSRSMAGNEFSFVTQKQIDGLTVNFLIDFPCGSRVCKAAVTCGAAQEKIRILENAGIRVLNFAISEIWLRPQEIAEELFTFLDTQAESASV